MKDIIKVTLLVSAIAVSSFSRAQSQTQNLVFDNNKFIYFKDNGGVDDGVRIGRHTGNALRIRYNANFFAFDALDDHPIIVTNSQSITGIRLDPASGHSYIKDGNVGIGVTSPSSRLHVKGANAGQEIYLESTGSDVGMTFKNTANPNSANIRYDGGTAGFEIRTNGTEASDTKMFIGDNGYVGIGTTSPGSHLDVNAGTNSIHAKFSGSFSGPQGIQVRRSGGADVKLLANYTSFGGGLQSSSALRFSVGGNSLTDASLFVDSSGLVGIGTTTPSNQLEVNGTIRSKEVIVEANNWPDYVFEPDYELPSLEETEEYIEENKHLPEIPSAKEIEENGVALGDMNRLLLKKIEELTLHTIEQQKLIEAQGEMIKELQNTVLRNEN